MAPNSTTKRVLVERFGQDTLPAYIRPPEWLAPDGLQLMEPEGVIRRLPYEEVKRVWFVRDLEQTRLPDFPRFFPSRPRTAGLWVRFRFRDEDEMEAVVPNNLVQLSPYGFHAIPPFHRLGPQHVFVPRLALAECTVLGVIKTPLARGKRPPAPAMQYRLFDEKPG